LAIQFTIAPGSNAHKCAFCNEILHTDEVWEGLQNGEGLC